MRTCFMLPGLLGSELYTPDDETFHNVPLWANAGRLVGNREFGGLALAANGVDPHPDYGERCVAGGAIGQYYQGLYSTLRLQLDPHGYDVVDWGYDWRFSISTIGNRLVDAIRDKATPADPCSIVAHSQGGLVARWAWTVLGVSGDHNLVRRIVTLGTPHKGAYAPVGVWSLNEPMLRELVYYSNLYTNIQPFMEWFSPTGWVSYVDVERVAASWPSMYQLMPLVDEASQIYDPRRAELFDLRNWPAERNLSEVHLSIAAGAFRDWLRLPASTPPTSVLTTVGAVGFSTPWALRSEGEIGSAESIEYTAQGDGRVAIDSAIVTPGEALIVTGMHDALPSHPGILARIGDLVLRTNPLPPPAVAGEDFTVTSLPIAGPPFPSLVGGRSDGRNCSDGTCYC